MFVFGNVQKRKCIIAKIAAINSKNNGNATCINICLYVYLTTIILIGSMVKCPRNIVLLRMREV